MKTDNKGFSLIELMIVLCIIVVLLSTASLSFVYSKPERNLKKAAAQVYMDFQEAKSRAVLDRAPTQIQFDESADSYTVTISGQTRTVSLASFGSDITFGPGPAKYKVNNSSLFTGNFVTFDLNTSQPQFRDVGFQPNGMLNSFGGYAYLTNNSNTACYAIGVPQVTGRVVMRKTELEKWPND